MPTNAASHRDPCVPDPTATAAIGGWRPRRARALALVAALSLSAAPLAACRRQPGPHGPIIKVGKADRVGPTARAGAPSAAAVPAPAAIPPPPPAPRGKHIVIAYSSNLV